MSRELKRVLSSDPALSQTLRSLPRRTSPVDLTHRLRGIAERERLYRTPWARVRATCKETATRWVRLAHVNFENVMRPLAVPVAGGVFSAVTLFSVGVAPAYPVISRSVHFEQTDVPTKLTTDPRLSEHTAETEDSRNRIAYGLVADDLLVEVTVDNLGSMTDYRIVDAIHVPDSERKRLEENLMRTKFKPATSFGKPTSGRLRLWFSRFEVKG